MKQFSVLVFAAVFAATPVLSEDSGTSLMERGAKMFLEGILREIEPAIDDLQGLADSVQPAMRSFVEEMGPALMQLLEKIEDFSAYHPPEILPNGDIIMRKKTPAEMDPTKTGADTEIET